MQPHTKSAHYLATTYDTKARFASYWQQAQLIQSTNATNFLDIGTGNGFLKDYLQRRNITLTTVDADCKLTPDICASITTLPLQDKSFDAVSCFQVLEHLDFIYFAPALRELRRVSRGRAFISLPDVGLNLSIGIRLDKLINISCRLPLHVVKTSLREDSEHKWEINRKGYPLRRIKREITSAGWEIRRTFRLFENPYHRFFILEN
mgnify:CR=1 FL=1